MKNVTIEICEFGPQKLMNPAIQGNKYQQGQTWLSQNSILYICRKFLHLPQVCKKKNKTLNTHDMA
ncbi:hypothetical protein [Neobacillus soli]|uniref:hypothetical protein n=1 Tax=Neobacillus soli TaxID=220688 RepID=UPI001C57740A|nr:hypothetical protein [Neobacillus soli]